MTAQAELEESARRLRPVVAGLIAVFNGGDSQTVNNGSEDLPTVAKLLRDADERINTGAESVLAGATDAKDAAEAAQAASEVARAETEGLTTAAAASAAAADASANNAIAATNTWDTEPLGRPHVADGQLFLVKTADPQVFSMYRRDNSGASTLLGTISIASAAALAAMLESLNADGLPAGTLFTDSDGNIAGRVAADGTLEFYSAALADLQTSGDVVHGGTVTTGATVTLMGESPLYAVEYCDQHGNVNQRIRRDGGVEIAPAAPLPDLGPLSLPFTVEYLPQYGQSESVGNLATPSLSTANRFGDLMFSPAGTRIQDTPSDPAATIYTSLVPLVESDQTIGGIAYGETPNSGAVEAIHELIASENGVPGDKQGVRFLACSPGQGGSSLATLSKGGTIYTRLTDQISYGKSLSQAAGETFGFRMVCLTQGNQDENIDTTEAAYLARIKTFRANLSADRAAILGTAYDLALSVCQDNSHKAYANAYPNVAIAQWKASLEDPRIFIACPHYLFDTVDSIHLVNSNSKWLGAYHGVVYKRVILEGRSWVGVRPLHGSGRRAGSAVYLDFETQVGGLVFDTSRVSNPGNFGFSLVDAGGADIALANAPEIVAPRRIKFTPVGGAPPVAKVRYGFNSVGGTTNRSAGPRGCLRDQQGDRQDRFDPNGINAALHNYCLIFEETIA